MFRRLLVVILFLLSAFSFGSVDVSNATIVLQNGASATETFTAYELRDYLSQAVGVELKLVQTDNWSYSNAIIVGQGALASKLLPYVHWDTLGPEQTLIKSVGRSDIVVAGGRPRGTMYAAYRLLQEKCGVRWWAPWAISVPNNPELKLVDINWTETPAFEYREPYWAHTGDPTWSIRNFSNGSSIKVDDTRGGKITYQGFVHTYNVLVPPAQNFAAHPEWYSLINGKRTFENAQLCTTNPALRDYIVEQVKEELRLNPAATIVSVSQNDCFNPCQCPVCRALSEKEGSDSALVLDLANYVADHIKDEFPKVAVDTLAYQWSRHPPKTMKPRPNVIVRLCSIECNFAQPLSAAVNQSFADDIKGWNKLTDRLYIWDYCTNFAHYLQPQPDYFSLGTTLKWFSQNGVKGVFEEGDYTSTGGDMAELKAWVIGQMLWNPKQDPDALVNEFVHGYYGPAAPPILEYLHLMADQAQTTHVSFALNSNALFLRYEVMSKAKKLWDRAKDLAHADPKFAARVRMSSLSPESVWLARWNEFRTAARLHGDTWPLEENRADVAADWLTSTQIIRNMPGYTSITAVDEGGTSPRQFLDGLEADKGTPPPPPPPPVVMPAPRGLPNGTDFPASLANLIGGPAKAEIRDDPIASYGSACWMPGDHSDRAFQLPLNKVPLKGKYRVYAIVKVDTDATEGATAFSAGVFDADTGQDVMSKKFDLKDVKPGYRPYLIGVITDKPGLNVWVAPPNNERIHALWIERIYLVKH